MSDSKSSPAPAPQPPKKRTAALSATGARKTASKPPRSRAREFALQALYQYLLSGNSMESIDAFTRDLSGFNKADAVHYDALAYGCAREASTLDALIAPQLDRPWPEISPIEHAVLWIGAYEFAHCLDVPYRVVINECIELAKAFGGTDGHKYINGVLDKLAVLQRPQETANHG
jgi:N utilization substance protein B